MVAGDFVDLIELSPNFSIIETFTKQAWIGKTIRGIGFREKYNINVIAVKENNHIDVSPDPDMPLKASQMLVLIGANKSLKEIDILV